MQAVYTVTTITSSHGNIKILCEENQIPYNHLFSVLNKCQQARNENYARVLRRALNGIRRHPTAIRTLADAMSVDGVGDKLGAEIVRCLDKAKENGIQVRPIEARPTKPKEKRTVSSSSEEPICKKIRGHLFEPGKGPWSVLLCLGKLNGSGSKAMIMRQGIDLNLAANIKEVWSNSMSSLRSKNLLESNDDGSISLTEEGRLVAAVVQETYDKNPALFSAAGIRDDNVAMNLSNGMSAASQLSLPQTSTLSLPHTQASDAATIATYEYDLTLDIDSNYVPPTAMLSLRDRIALSSSKTVIQSVNKPVASPAVSLATKVEEGWTLDLTEEERVFCMGGNLATSTSNAGVIIDLIQGDEDLPYASQESARSLPLSQSQSLRHHTIDISSLTQTAVASSSSRSRLVMASETYQNQAAATDSQTSYMSTQTYTAVTAAAATEPMVVASTDPEAIALGMSLLTKATNLRRVCRPALSVADAPATRVTVLNPRDWEVTFIVDQRERDNVLIQSKLLEASIPCVVTNLSVGDFLFIARPLAASVTGNLAQALVLDAIAERKTFHDLSSSIIDGRYEEQKSRLKECKVRSKIYLIEGVSLSNTNIGSAKNAALRTAMLSVQIDSDLQVIRTRSLDHSIDFFKSLYR
jgi:hypothetical protein